MENDKLPPRRPLPEWLPAVPSTSAGPPSSKVSERRSRLKKHTKPLAVVSPQQHGNTVLPIERPGNYNCSFIIYMLLNCSNEF